MDHFGLTKRVFPNVPRNFGGWTAGIKDEERSRTSVQKVPDLIMRLAKYLPLHFSYWAEKTCWYCMGRRGGPEQMSFSDFAILVSPGLG